MRRPFLPALLAAASMAGAEPAGTVDRIEREVYLMGTRASLVTYDDSRARGLSRLEAFLRVLERTEDELSTWREDSVLSRFNRSPVGEPFRLPPDLCEMFLDVWQWSEATGGRFDPAVGAILDVWGIQHHGRAATPDEVEDARTRSGLSRIAFDRERCTFARLADVRLDAGAFGKGEALDRVAALPDATGYPWLVDLGGQIAVGGSPPGQAAWDVALAHPDDRREAALRLALDGGSIATSGGSERDVTVARRRISHIVDPRTAEPGTYGGSVTVWHPQALAADALSTALFVMGPDEGLAWADRHQVAVCYLDADRGRVKARPSRAFEARFYRFLNSPQVSISDP